MLSLPLLHPPIPGSDHSAHRTTEIHDAFQASANPIQRELAARTQSAGTTLEVLRRRKDAGVTEKRVIYPPGGLTHVSIAGPTSTSTTAPTGSIERDLSYSASSPVRRQSIAAPPAGVRLVGNPVRACVRAWVCMCVHVYGRVVHACMGVCMHACMGVVGDGKHSLGTPPPVLCLGGPGTHWSWKGC